MARPNKYFTHVEPNLDKIAEMRTYMTEAQIAKTLGVSLTAWKEYKRLYPAIDAQLKKGIIDLVSDLRSALIKRAKGYEYTETKIVSEEVVLPPPMIEALIDAGFTKEDIKAGRLVRTEVAKKQMAPDVAALNLSLKNYDKDNWANDPQALEIRREELELQRQKVEQNAW